MLSVLLIDVKSTSRDHRLYSMKCTYRPLYLPRSLILIEAGLALLPSLSSSLYGYIHKGIVWPDNHGDPCTLCGHVLHGDNNAMWLDALSLSLTLFLYNYIIVIDLIQENKCYVSVINSSQMQIIKIRKLICC